MVFTLGTNDGSFDVEKQLGYLIVFFFALEWVTEMVIYLWIMEGIILEPLLGNPVGNDDGITLWSNNW